MSSQTTNHRPFAPGTREWKSNSILHRIDGPAVVQPDGKELWFFHGKLHRDNGPAVVQPDGLQEWWHRGALHRNEEGMPARIYPDGSAEYWENGVKLTYNDPTPKVTEQPKENIPDKPAANYDNELIYNNNMPIQTVLVEDLVHDYIVKKALYLNLVKELKRITEAYNIARDEYHKAIDKYTENLQNQTNL